ncbi:MAG: acyl-CoA dehydrogenase family protein [Chloroflexota bacterium]|nr:acyl-CoA dehydrogenase family protein [Chloroflexota bacterium]
MNNEGNARPVPPVDFFLTESLLSNEERAMRDRVRAFAERELRPVARAAWEEAEFPARLVPELAALGIGGGTAKGYGCPAMSSVAYGLALQELSRVDSSFATFFTVQAGLTVTTIAACGSEEQKARWLPRLARGEAIGAFALTEPDHGSDVSRLATRATRDGNDYVLDGTKRWIGNGTLCDVVVVWARAEDGIAGFLVERPNSGLVATKIEGKLAQRGVWQAEIRLGGCRVPTANRLPRGGFRTVAEVLARSRHGVAWHALGEAIACYEIARDHALCREQFGKPLAAFQLVQAKLVRMLGEISKAQLLVIQLGRLLDQEEATAGMTAYAKLSCAAMAREVAATARDLLGGDGILLDREVMRHLCDLEGVSTYEGTHDVNALIVGREITGLAAFA